MKRHSILIFLMAMTLSSCSLLYSEDEEKLSGSEFWDGASQADVNSFANGMYAELRTATMQNAAFFPFSGDFRCAPIGTRLSTTSSSGKFVTALITNDLNLLRQTYTADKAPYADGIMRWQDFYKVVQTANIMIREVDRASISDLQKKAAKAEAVFARCLTYFLLVRNFGAVPYYTNAYNSEPLPRTDMVTVLKNILSELQGLLDSDPGQTILPMVRTGNDRGIKASRGAVLALMMHVNMWLAGFDITSKGTYYKNVVDLGGQLVDDNGGVYSLVPIEQMTNSVFKGSSDEGLFEIAQNITYFSGNEVFKTQAVFSDYVMYTPFTNKSYSNIYYTYEFLSKIFPPGESDDRVTYWFDQNIYSTDTDVPKEITKFKNVDTYDEKSVTSNSGNFIVFRLADAILLYAEALAELGSDDSKACELLNRIRTRANASTVQLTGQELKDAIYWERVREMIGEGQYFYDLVRTKKVCNSNYCWHTITLSQFNEGAWTWPISRVALNNNTHMSLNQYWE